MCVALKATQRAEETVGRKDGREEVEEEQAKRFRLACACACVCASIQRPHNRFQTHMKFNNPIIFVSGKLEIVVK